MDPSLWPGLDTVAMALPEEKSESQGRMPHSSGLPVGWGLWRRKSVLFQTPDTEPHSTWPPTTVSSFSKLLHRQGAGFSPSTRACMEAVRTTGLSETQKLEFRAMLFPCSQAGLQRPLSTHRDKVVTEKLLWGQKPPFTSCSSLGCYRNSGKDFTSLDGHTLSSRVGAVVSFPRL